MRNVLPLLFLPVLLGACASPSVPPPPSAAPTASATAPATMPGPARDADAPTPPVARKIPHARTLHGETRNDDYFWLREKGSPDVLAYLNAEKAYAEDMTKPTAPLRETLYQEMLGRIKETDESVPVKIGAWVYYSRTEAGKSYPIRCRKRAGKGGEPTGAEVVLVDPNEIAKTEKYVGIGATALSDDGNLFAYGLDTTGFRQFTLHIKDMRTGVERPERIARVDSFAFAKDNRTIVYVTEDAQTKRSDHAFRHVTGEDVAKDTPIYVEGDERFDVTVRRSRSLAYIFLTSRSKVTTEVRAIKADAPTVAPRVLVPREQGHEYYVDHRGDRFYFMTNSAGRNFRIVSTPVGDTSRAAWKEIVPHRDTVMIEDVNVFADHYVVVERENALPRIVITSFLDGKSHTISFSEPDFDLGPEQNPEFDTHAFRFEYESFLTPSSTYDFDTKTHERKLLKRTDVPTFDGSRYTTARAYATAKDGTKIPLSILSKSAPTKGPRPLYLEAYGSYGMPFEVRFNSAIFSLVDRGFTYVIAHIRGGGDGGKRWHDEGRMMAKMTTFTDFIACGEYLVSEGFTTPSQMAINGASAGGLLMGAVTNMRPDLWKAVIARVPFVDVINTMADETLPLTVAEFEEWGNPKIKTQYDAMMAYSPYDNVTAKAYPAILVESSYNDSQVMYWEPAKYVAKLRALKTDANPLLFKISMDPAGHGGASGRYDRLRERAYEQAFVITQITTPPH